MAKKETPEQPIRVEAPAVTTKEKASRARQTSVGAIQAVKNVRKDGVAEELPESENRLVEIMVDEELFINGQRLFGLVTVPVHQARSIIPMLQSKKRADIEVFTGRSFQVARAVNNRLVVKELDEE